MNYTQTTADVRTGQLVTVKKEVGQIMPYVDKDSAEIVATPVQRKMSGGSDLRSARTGSTAAGHKSRVPEAPAASITVNNNCASLPADGSGRHKHGLLSAMAGAWQEDSAAGL